jgi:Uncharacterized conserved protein
MSENFGILQIARFLQRLGLKISQMDYPRNNVELAFHDEHGTWKMVVGIHHSGQATKLMMIVPQFGILTDVRRLECLEALMFVNYRIAIGKFGVDPADGEIRLEESIPLAQDDLTFEQFQLALNALIQTVSIYHTLLTRIIDDNTTVQDALQACEREFFNTAEINEAPEPKAQPLLPPPGADETELDVDEVLAEVAWLLELRKD